MATYTCLCHNLRRRSTMRPSRSYMSVHIVGCQTQLYMCGLCSVWHSIAVFELHIGTKVRDGHADDPCRRLCHNLRRRTTMRPSGTASGCAEWLCTCFHPSECRCSKLPRIWSKVPPTGSSEFGRCVPNRLPGMKFAAFGVHSPEHLWVIHTCALTAYGQILVLVFPFAVSLSSSPFQACKPIEVSFGCNGCKLIPCEALSTCESLLISDRS